MIMMSSMRKIRMIMKVVVIMSLMMMKLSLEVSMKRRLRRIGIRRSIDSY
jgi:hypothetical protein